MFRLDAKLTERAEEANEGEHNELNVIALFASLTNSVRFIRIQ